MKTFKIENRSRTRVRFQAYRPGPTKDAPPERDPDRDIVIGDSQDTDEFLERKGVERNALCPSPVWTGTDADLARIGPQRAALAAMCAPPRKGEIDKGLPRLVMTEVT